MNWLDIIIVIAIGVSTLYSASKGAVKEIFSILSIVLGVIAGMLFYDEIGSALEGIIKSPDIAKVIGFIAVFLVVGVVVNSIGNKVRRFVKMAFLGWTDKLVGAGVGFVKGVLIIGVLMTLATAYLPAAKGPLGKSRLSVWMMSAVKRVSPMLPSDLEGSFKEKYETLKKYWEKYRM